MVVVRTLGELLVIGLIGLALGAAYNGARAKGALDWTKDYFALADDAENPIQEIGIDDIVDIVGDLDYDRWRFVFVDARSADVFADGRIQGAIRCWQADLAECIEFVLEPALGAEKVIVYCNGGKCDESKYMCRELVVRGVPRESIYLYAGGWDDWIANEMPFEVDEVVAEEVSE